MPMSLAGRCGGAALRAGTGTRHKTQTRKHNAGIMVERSIIVLALLVASAAAGAAAAPPETYAEKMVYDPQTGEWVVEPEAEPGTDAGDLEIARRTLAEGRARHAQRQLKAWLKHYGAASALHPEVLLQLARAEFELGNYMNAHKRYREVINGWPSSEWAERAARGDFLIAEVLLSGKRRKILGIPMLRAQDEGIEILDQISVDFANTPLAEEAIKTKADYYYAKGELDFAEDEYARLVREYPQSGQVRYAMRRSAEAALGQFGGIDFDDAPLAEAEERYDQYRTRFPSAVEEDVELIRGEITHKRAQKEYEIGGYYQRVGRLRAAAYYYRYVIKTWPGTTWAQLAEAELSRIQPLLGPEPEPAEQGPVFRTPTMQDAQTP